MKSISRRRFMHALAATPVALTMTVQGTLAADCTVQHPFMPPESRYQGQCPVCSMVRPMWARTWITFDPHRGVSQVCSFHCLADWIKKSGQTPTNIGLTVYHHPERHIPAAQAVIVMGSAAKGTMSPVSKIVFADRAEADVFAQTCGGAVVDFDHALTAAQQSLGQENTMINQRRLQKGKIVEPVEGDRCPVCGMLPIRYPYGKCQIQTKSGKILHFCSTQCMFAFQGKPQAYVDAPIDSLLIWVVDRGSGLWISARSAFYVVGATKVLGPMGYEALPFNSLGEAETFTVENGGKVMIFNDVTISAIVPQWKY